MFMDVQPFDNYEYLSNVDAANMPQGEQRVTLKGMYGGTMILRQGVIENHIWIYWTHNSVVKRVQFSIPFDEKVEVLWEEFFDVASRALDLRTKITTLAPPKKKKKFGIF